MIGTGTTISRSLGRNVAFLSMDNAFIQRRRDLQHLPRSPREAVLRPLRDIGNGLYYGVVGIVKAPYVSTKRYGLSGLPLGLAKGFVGLWVKPVVGALDAITHAGDSVRAIVKFVTQESNVPVYRQRFSSSFGPDGRLLSYSFPRALGTYILRALDRAQRENLNLGRAIDEGVGYLSSLSSLRCKIRGRKPKSGVDLNRRSSGAQYRRNDIDIMNDRNGDIDHFLGVNEYSHMEIEDDRGTPTLGGGLGIYLCMYICVYLLCIYVYIYIIYIYVYMYIYIYI
jgi:hypothetical protein